MHKVHFKGTQFFGGEWVTGPACGSIPNIDVNGKIQKALMSDDLNDVTCKRCLKYCGAIIKQHGS